MPRRHLARAKPGGCSGRHAGDPGGRTGRRRNAWGASRWPVGALRLTWPARSTPRDPPPRRLSGVDAGLSDCRPRAPWSLQSTVEARDGTPQLATTINRCSQMATVACRATFSSTDSPRSARPPSGSRAGHQCGQRDPRGGGADPVRLHLAEITRVSLLSGGEELALARRVECRDIAARRTLIEAGTLSLCH